MPRYQPFGLAMGQLRAKMRYMSSQLKGHFYSKLDHKTVMDNTRPGIMKRYQRAYHNIWANRVNVDERCARLSAFVKWEKVDECKKFDNKPPRIIQFRSYEYLYELKSYILNHSLLVKNNKGDIRWSDQPIDTIFTKIYDQRTMAKIVRESWDSFKDPIAICLDHSKFDGHYTLEHLKISRHYWYNVIYAKHMRNLLKLQRRNKGYTRHGIKYKMVGKRASGEYTTSEENTLINYAMLSTYCDVNGVLKYRIHVNGDDSIIICEREYADKLCGNLAWFEYLNMKTELDIATSNFCNIKYCQTSPIRDSRGDWVFIKDPIRAISRLSYSDKKYLHCIDRYLAGVGLCELACSAGIPLLQSFALFLLADSGLTRPLGSVDKIPAKLYSKVPLAIEPITMQTRLDFEEAFSIPVQQQIELENQMAGGLRIVPAIQAYITRYQNFHIN